MAHLNEYLGVPETLSKRRAQIRRRALDAGFEAIRRPGLLPQAASGDSGRANAVIPASSRRTRSDPVRGHRRGTQARAGTPSTHRRPASRRPMGRGSRLRVAVLDSVSQLGTPQLRARSSTAGRRVTGWRRALVSSPDARIRGRLQPVSLEEYGRPTRRDGTRRVIRSNIASSRWIATSSSARRSTRGSSMWNCCILR